MDTTPQERLVIYLLVGLLLFGSGVLALKYYHGPAWAGTAALSPSASPVPAADPASPVDLAPPGYPSLPGSPAAREAVAPASKPRIYVHVAGAVASPGVYQLERGSRVDDAIRAAGGATEQGRPEVLNLAAMLSDGEKVYIPTVKEVQAGTVPWGAPAPSGGGSSGGGGYGTGGKVNLNTATQEALERLPGVGPSTAERIIKYRLVKGPFKKIEDLRNVSGIGERKLEELRSYVVVY